MEFAFVGVEPDDGRDELVDLAGRQSGPGPGLGVIVVGVPGERVAEGEAQHGQVVPLLDAHGAESFGGGFAERVAGVRVVVVGVDRVRRVAVVWRERTAPAMLPSGRDGGCAIAVATVVAVAIE